MKTEVLIEKLRESIKTWKTAPKDQRLTLGKEIAKLYKTLRPHIKPSKVLGREDAVIASKLANRYKNCITGRRKYKEGKAVRISKVVNLSYRLHKLKQRKWLLEQAAKLDRDVRALTLPGTEWHFEKDLLLTGRCKLIVGLERDNDVYEYSQLIRPVHKNVVFLNLSDEEFLNSPKGRLTFNLIWLDYMCIFSQRALNIFSTILRRGFADPSGTVIATTFVAGLDRNSAYHLYREVDPNFTSPDRTRIIPELFARAARSLGWQCEVLKSEWYHEKMGKQRSMPMIFVALMVKRARTKQRRAA